MDFGLSELDGLNPERVVNALEAIGMGQWAVEYASAYARDRARARATEVLLAR